MVVTYYIKLFRNGADRHNGILMSLLLLGAETIIQVFHQRERSDFSLMAVKIEQWHEDNCCYNRRSCFMKQRCIYSLVQVCSALDFIILFLLVL